MYNFPVWAKLFFTIFRILPINSDKTCLDLLPGYGLLNSVLLLIRWVLLFVCKGATERVHFNKGKVEDMRELYPLEMG